MSHTATALFAKFLMTLVVSGITLGYIAGSTWWGILLFSVAATALNYLLGDLIVLPRMGNLIASAGDGLLAAVTAYVLTFFITGLRTTTPALVLLALLVAIGEYVFHMYLRADRKVQPKGIAGSSLFGWNMRPSCDIL
ncbi:DUF2512 family protein [Heliobacterium undosum]|uniref:DUF2512 family protein n=1 Tax=Heliomicrobium undosum TaxID=121734 RepID=A0A845L476_9FIRM|nr:DUF2512 family protein [Heliomicrobium undosum]MZP29979.1 DUF2512 family protein [Heliomicrobium undosum]